MEIKPKTYKGVELTYTINEHKPQVENKVTLSFELGGTTYKNAAIVPVTAEDADIKAELTKLVKWAHTIINDHQPKK